MRRPLAWLAVCLGLLTLTLSEAVAADAYLFLPVERQTTGSRVRNAFKDSAAPASAWTVEVRRGKSEVALGLVVSPKGQVLTKLSEVLPTNGGSTQLTSTSGSDPAGGRLTCVMPGGKTVDAAVLAADPDTDLALLKVEMEGLRTPEWERNFDVRLGRWVVTPAIGGSVSTVGIVSAAARRIPAEKVSGVLGVQLELGGRSGSDS